MTARHRQKTYSRMPQAQLETHSTAQSGRERSHPKRSDVSKPPYTALLRVGNRTREDCTQDAQASTTSSSEEGHFRHPKTFLSSKTQSNGKGAKPSTFTIHSPQMAHSRLVQDLPRFFAKAAVGIFKWIAQWSSLGSGLDFLFVAHSLYLLHLSRPTALYMH